MSKIVVRAISRIHPHSNADRLEVAIIDELSCVIPRARYQVGDAVVFVPAGTVLPDDLIDRLEVRRYLEGNTVKNATIRGVTSHGLILANEQGWVVGEDVSHHFGFVRETVQAHRQDAQDLRDAFASAPSIKHPSFVLEREQTMLLLAHLSELLLETEDKMNVLDLVLEFEDLSTLSSTLTLQLERLNEEIQSLREKQA